MYSDVVVSGDALNTFVVDGAAIVTILVGVMGGYVKYFKPWLAEKFDELNHNVTTRLNTVEVTQKEATAQLTSTTETVDFIKKNMVSLEDHTRLVGRVDVLEKDRRSHT